MPRVVGLELLKRHDVKLGCITQYKLGPFKLKEELRMGARLGCETMVTEGNGPKGLQGEELKFSQRLCRRDETPIGSCRGDRN